MTEIDLDLIADSLREKAVEALEAGDVLGYLGKAAGGNTWWLDIVAQNATALRERGLYEEALLHAWSSTRMNHAHQSLYLIRWLFSLADPTKLRALGDPLPGPGPFILYRGVAGVGARRRVRGVSWTSSPDCACWFARRLGLLKPTVLRLQLDAQNVVDEALFRLSLDDCMESDQLAGLPPITFFSQSSDSVYSSSQSLSSSGPKRL